MPYYLGCCCMNAFSARNIVRYQYRIKPTFDEDIYDELLIPLLYVFGGLLLCNPIIGMSLQLALSVQLFREVKVRPKCESKRYLSGYQCDYDIPILPVEVIIMTPRNITQEEDGNIEGENNEHNTTTNTTTNTHNNDNNTIDVNSLPAVQSSEVSAKPVVIAESEVHVYTPHLRVVSTGRGESSASIEDIRNMDLY